MLIAFCLPSTPPARKNSILANAMKATQEMVSSALWRSVCQSSRLRHRLVAMLAVAVQTPRVSTMTKPSNQYAFAMTATAATAFSALPSVRWLPFTEINHLTLPDN